MNTETQNSTAPDLSNTVLAECAFFSESEIEDFKNGSIQFPFMIYDGNNDYNIVEVNEVVSLSGMADNEGTPNELTIYKHVKGKETQHLVYRLVQ